MPLIKCYKCNWEGDETELVEVQGNLIFYDYVAINTMNVEVTRTNHLCPKCSEMLRSHRLVNGMVFDT